MRLMAASKRGAAAWAWATCGISETDDGGKEKCWKITLNIFLPFDEKTCLIRFGLIPALELWPLRFLGFDYIIKTKLLILGVNGNSEMIKSSCQQTKSSKIIIAEIVPLFYLKAKVTTSLPEFLTVWLTSSDQVHFKKENIITVWIFFWAVNLNELRTTLLGGGKQQGELMLNLESNNIFIYWLISVSQLSLEAETALEARGGRQRVPTAGLRSNVIDLHYGFLTNVSKIAT